MANIPLISKVEELAKISSSSAPVSTEHIQKLIVEYENVLTPKELEQIAIIIVDHWKTSEKDSITKKRLIPYKIKLLYKNSSSKVELSELPYDLLLKIYVYLVYIYN